MDMSAHEQLARFLRSWADIPDAELIKAVEIFRPVSVPRDTIFQRAGEVPRTLGFIVSGIARVYYIDPDGHEWINSFRAENQFVCAYGALLRNEPSRQFIQMLEPTELLVASYRSYQQLSARHECWKDVRLKMAEWLHFEQDQRQSQLLLDDAATRYAKFLVTYPGLATRLKQRHIASYLGITPVSLSRIRSQASPS